MTLVSWATFLHIFKCSYEELSCISVNYLNIQHHPYLPSITDKPAALIRQWIKVLRYDMLGGWWKLGGWIRFWCCTCRSCCGCGSGRCRFWHQRSCQGSSSFSPSALFRGNGCSLSCTSSASPSVRVPWSRPSACRSALSKRSPPISCSPSVPKTPSSDFSTPPRSCSLDAWQASQPWIS